MGDKEERLLSDNRAKHLQVRERVIFASEDFLKHELTKVVAAHSYVCGRIPLFGSWHIPTWPVWRPD